MKTPVFALVKRLSANFYQIKFLKCGHISRVSIHNLNSLKSSDCTNCRVMSGGSPRRRRKSTAPRALSKP